jgi:hypothetical protein
MLALHPVELAVGRLKGSITEPPRRIRVEAEFLQHSSTARPAELPAAGIAHSLTLYGTKVRTASW